MPSRPDPAQALLALGAATLGESGGHPMRARIKPAWRGARLAAPAFTARCRPGDNLAIHAAVARAPAGSALVVDGAERELGYWGEVLTAAAEARGLLGLVIDGGVRDVTALEAHGFPVFSTGVALPGTTKELPGAIGGTVEGAIVLAARQARAENETRIFETVSRWRDDRRLAGPRPVAGR